MQSTLVASWSAPLSRSGISAANRQQIACHSAIACAIGPCAGSRLAVGLSSTQQDMITKHLRATAILAAVCRKVDRRHQVASASVPSLRLRKGKRLACRGRHAKDVEDHRYQRVVAEDAHELDGRSLAENVTHARERLIADAPRLVELLDEVVDRALVFRR